ncbi:siderophore ferric iron reductase [Achromobacter aegrifaciens]
MTRELDDLLALAGGLVPGLDGRAGPPAAPGIRPGASNADAIARLRDWWRERHPEAGPHYLALRCWGLLIWQPVYLCVIAAHRSCIVPDLTRLSQPVANGFIAGYTIERHEPLRGGLDERLDVAATQLRAVGAMFYRELGETLRLNPRAAACMQADCVLSALLAARPGVSAADNAWAAEAAAHWLMRLGISGSSGYLTYQRGPLPAIAVDRQVCCHHFRRSDGDYCSTCPKLDIAERIARIDAESAEPA